MFYGLHGYREATLAQVTDIAGETVYVDDETGVTFDANGREKETFFPGMRCEITPLGAEATKILARKK